MNRLLNNVLKGLLTAFVVIVTGGFIALNIKTSPGASMVLVSSSVVNSIRTETKLAKREEVKVEEISTVEEKEPEKETTEEKEEIKEEIKEEPKQEEPPKTEEVQPVVETPKVEEQPVVSEPSIPSANGNYSPNTETTSGAGNQTFSGYVTAYGPDCYGCYGGSTALGDYVGDGNIYYNHPTYGTIRIVAGDRSILNKVVRITGLNISSEPVIAIVRDTGGDIGFNKPKGIVLDLLYTSERSSEVLNFGMQWATVEVLN